MMIKRTGWMSVLALLAAGLAGCAGPKTASEEATAHDHDHDETHAAMTVLPGSGDSVPLYDDLGSYHRRIATDSEAAAERLSTSGSSGHAAATSDICRAYAESRGARSAVGSSAYRAARASISARSPAGASVASARARSIASRARAPDAESIGALMFGPAARAIPHQHIAQPGSCTSAAR